MNEWQKIETAPKDGTVFVGCWVCVVSDGVPQWAADVAMWDGERFRVTNARHGPPEFWMPLPSPLPEK